MPTTMIEPKKIKTLKFFTRYVKSGVLQITFPDLCNSSTEVKSGKHINSLNNWSRYAPHGNSRKKTPIFEIEKRTWRDFQIHITEMENLNEGSQFIKYRLSVSGSFGNFGHVATADISLSKADFLELTKGLESRKAKGRKIFEL